MGMSQKNRNKVAFVAHKGIIFFEKKNKSVS